VRVHLAVRNYLVHLIGSVRGGREGGRQWGSQWGREGVCADASGGWGSPRRRASWATGVARPTLEQGVVALKMVVVRLVELCTVLSR